jgi:Ni,Fe-hydrogenase I cytochrome b subunit
MNELQNFTFFPKSGSWHGIQYCLQVYFGLDKKQIEEIKHLPNRWVTVMRNYPMAVLYSNGTYLI